MSRPRDYLVALAGALWIHVLAAVVLTRWTPRTVGFVPLFRPGVSSLSLTVIAATEPAPSAPPSFENAVPAEPIERPEPPARPAAVSPPEPPRQDEPQMVPEVAPVATLPSAPDRDVDTPPDTPDEGPHVPPEPAAGGEDGHQMDRGLETLTAVEVNVRPRYPLGARLRGEEGTVLLRVRVNPAGRAENIVTVASSGFPALDRAAKTALLRATFRPREGRASPAGEFLISIRFQLVD